MTEIRVLSSPGDIAHAAARIFTDAAKRAVAESGRFTVALSGGRTPSVLYRLLAGEGSLEYCASIPWSRVHLFWSDERHVPPTHPDSNYRMAAGTLIDHVPIPPAQVHRVRSEDPSAEKAAADYERTLREVFGLVEGQYPVIDLMILGMGADGHTASIFPHSPALKETTRLVVAPRVANARARRITMTPPVLTAAAATVVLVAGAEKAATLRAVLEGPADPDRLPIQCLRAARHAVTWLVDRAAALHLTLPIASDT